MAAIWYRLRAETRSTWRLQLVAAVVLSVVFGGALASVAGARRTDSAVRRLVDATAHADVVVNPDRGTFSALTHEAVLSLPEVERGGAVFGMFVAPLLPDGSLDVNPDVLAIAATGGVGYEMSTPLVKRGTMPDPADPGAVLLSEEFAAQHDLGPGDTLEAGVLSMTELQAWEEAGGEGPPSFDPIDLRIVGIGRYADEVQVEDGFSLQRMTLTPAFFAAHEDSAGFWGGHYDLADPDDRTGFERSVRALAPDEAIAFQWTATMEQRFADAIWPQAVSLYVFGATLGLVGLLGAVAGQARLADRLARDRRLLAAMGLTRGRVVLLGLSTGALAGTVIAAAAVAFAIVGSGFSPIGPARDAEPAPGLVADASVLVPGAFGIAVALVGIGCIVTWLADRRETVGHQSVRGSRLVEALSTRGSSAPVVVGVRMAVERGAGAGQVPVRGTLVGAAAAIAAVLAASTFAASLNRVVETPRLYGSNWDAVITMAPPAADISGPESFAAAFATLDQQTERAARDLANRSGVEGVSVAGFAQLAIEGVPVPAFGIDPVSGAAYPTLVSGRIPAASDEIVLGSRTLRVLGADLGDVVAVEGRKYTVVGRAVFPGFGVYQAQDKTAMGTGAWLTLDGLDAAGPGFLGRGVLVAVAETVDAAQLLSDFQPEDLLGADLGDEPVAFDRYRPVEVDTLRRVQGTPTLLAGLLGAIHALAVVFVLVTAVRRRGPLLAVLRVLGFERRQVSRSVQWMAVTVAAVAVMVGVPFGLGYGRWSWGALINRLGGHADAVIPWGTVVVAIAATIAVTLLASAVPARRAARLRPALLLRAE